MSMVVIHASMGLAVWVKGDPQAVDGDTKQTDIRPGKNNPDGADHIPRNQQGNGQGHQACGNSLHPFFGMARGNHYPQGNFDEQDEPGKEELTPEGILQTLVGHHLFEPFSTHKKPVGPAPRYPEVE